MKKTTILLLSIAIILGISSCTKKSEKIIDCYFEAYNNKNFSEINDLSYSNTGNMMEELSEDLYESLGEVESYKILI